jgi:DNA-binding response OmpR family regulator
MSHLLVVEDDATIGAALVSALEAQGYRVGWQRTGRSALAEAVASRPDLVLLDLGLPDGDGIDVCRELRGALPAAVIVILTARQDEIDVIAGLDAGADDYLRKPFRMVEVSARIRAHLRRAHSTTTAADDPILTVGSLTIDRSARRVRVDDVEIPLRAREFDLLARLALCPGVAVDRETLMADVWDTNWYGSTKTLDVHMVAVRRKLVAAAQSAGPDAVDNLPTITTLRGHGYRLEPGVDHPDAVS